MFLVPKWSPVHGKLLAVTDCMITAAKIHKFLLRKRLFFLVNSTSKTIIFHHSEIYANERSEKSARQANLFRLKMINVPWNFIRLIWSLS